MPGKSTPYINCFVAFGDSLSDRHEMYERNIGGIFKARKKLTLGDHSPRGRFTNGYNWLDYFILAMSHQAIITAIAYQMRLSVKQVGQQLKDEDIKISQLYKSCQDSVFQHGTLFGQPFFDVFAQGGLTAHDYSWSEDLDLVQISKMFPTRAIVQSLRTMRERLIQLDIARQKSLTDKASTLVIESTGLNDLITVNEEPTMLAVDKAIKARINHVKSLIANGYQNFVLFNLPDISLTPGYKDKSPELKDNARRCIDAFNLKLQKEMSTLRTHFPFCRFEMMDVHERIAEIYRTPKKYGFDPSLHKETLIDSPQYEMRDGIAAGDAYMYWDPFHPSADLSAIMGTMVQDFITEKFEIVSPTFIVKPSVDFSAKEFVDAYKGLIESQGGSINRFLAQFVETGMSEESIAQAQLNAIFYWGVIRRHPKVLATMQELTWVDKSCQLRLDKIPVLQVALAHAKTSAKASDLVDIFLEQYEKKLGQHPKGMIKMLDKSTKPRMEKSAKALLDQLFYEALMDGNEDVKQTMEHLGWLSQDNQLTFDNPILQAAYDEYRFKSALNALT